MNTFSFHLIRYRLRSEIKSISRLADLLTDKGQIIDISTLSRWQNGNRTPTNRGILIILLDLFIERGGIRNIEEANAFLESAEMGYLTEEEKRRVNLVSLGPFLIPPKLDSFVGRNEILNDIKINLSENSVLILGGMGGIGKSVLAIEYAHKYKYKYPDGVLWAKLDTANSMSVLSTFAHSYGEDVNQFRDISSRSQVVRSLLSNKRILIILDNVTQNEQIEYLVPNNNRNHLIITSRVKHYKSISNAKIIDVEKFTEEEAYLVFEKKLGSGYSKKNKKILIKLSNRVNRLPLAVDLLAERFIYLKNLDVKKSESLFNSSVANGWDGNGKSIQELFESSFSILSSKEKKVFVSTAAFEGSSFSYETVAYINKFDEILTIGILEKLCEISLLQKADYGNRYKIHPLTHEFVKSKLKDFNLCILLGNYFLSKYRKFNEREKVINIGGFEKDVETISNLIKKLYEIKNYELVVDIWEYFVLTLWDLGFWDLHIELSEYILKISGKINDPILKARVLIRDLGILYFQRNQLEKTEKVIKEGLEISKKNKNNFLIAYAKLRYGMIYLQRDKLESSLKYLKDALEKFTIQDEKGRIGEVLCYMSSVYHKKNKDKLAINFCKKAYRKCAQIDHKRGMSDALSYEAEIHLDNKNFFKSKELLKESIRIDEEIRRIGQIWIYNQLALKAISCITGKSNYKSFYKMFLDLKKSVNLEWRLNNLLDFVNIHSKS